MTYEFPAKNEFSVQLPAENNLFQADFQLLAGNYSEPVKKKQRFPNQHRICGLEYGYRSFSLPFRDCWYRIKIFKSGNKVYSLIENHYSFCNHEKPTSPIPHIPHYISLILSWQKTLAIWGVLLPFKLAICLPKTSVVCTVMISETCPNLMVHLAGHNGALTWLQPDFEIWSKEGLSQYTSCRVARKLTSHTTRPS